MTRKPLLERIQDLLRRPLASATLGGLIVLVAGAIAVEAGWIGEEHTVVSEIPAGAPVEAQSDGALTVNEIYDQHGPGVVFVRAQVEQQGESPFGLPERQQGESTGSGLIIDDDGHVLTNAHVVEGSKEIEIGFEDDKTASAKVVGRDASNDVALLKIEDADGADLEVLPLADSSKVEVGDPVVAIGNPFGLDRTVTTGIVSALQRQLQAPNGFTIQDVIQTDAAINPGNSGGPLFDGRGRVIGINSQIATAGGGGNIGIGFAVPINKAKEIVKELREKGRVERAYLGITGISITDSLAERLSLGSTRGALVQQVTGPARKAGVKAGNTQVTINGQELLLGGDVITKVDDQKIESMDDVIAYVDRKKPGDEVKLELRRGSKTRTVEVKLEQRPESADIGGRQPQGGQDSIP